MVILKLSCPRRLACVRVQQTENGHRQTPGVVTCYGPVSHPGEITDSLPLTLAQTCDNCLMRKKSLN